MSCPSELHPALWGLRTGTAAGPASIPSKSCGELTPHLELSPIPGSQPTSPVGEYRPAVSGHGQGLTFEPLKQREGRPLLPAQQRGLRASYSWGLKCGPGHTRLRILKATGLRVLHTPLWPASVVAASPGTQLALGTARAAPPPGCPDLPKATAPCHSCSLARRSRGPSNSPPPPHPCWPHLHNYRSWQRLPPCPKHILIRRLPLELDPHGHLHPETHPEWAAVGTCSLPRAGQPWPIGHSQRALLFPCSESP